MKGFLIALSLLLVGAVSYAQPKPPRNGKYVLSYANGNDSLVCYYKDGLLEGQRMLYYPSGQVHIMESLKQGRPRALRQYYENGALKRQETHDGQTIHGHCYDEQGREVYFTPYVMPPRFPGGNEELHRLLGEYIQYPPESEKARKEGRVLIRCKVERDGKTTDVKVVESVSPELDNEAMRVVAFLALKHHWIPGMIDGKPDSFYMNIPIRFRLHPRVNSRKSSPN